MKTPKKFLFLLTFLAISNNAIFARYIKEEKRELAKDAGKKETLTIEKGDAVLRVGGIPKIEFLMSTVLVFSS